MWDMLSKPMLRRVLRPILGIYGSMEETTLRYIPCQTYRSVRNRVRYSPGPSGNARYTSRHGLGREPQTPYFRVYPTEHKLDIVYLQINIHLAYHINLGCRGQSEIIVWDTDAGYEYSHRTRVSTCYDYSSMILVWDGGDHLGCPQGISLKTTSS